MSVRFKKPCDLHLCWSLGWGLNPRPAHYKCAALPLSYPGQCQVTILSITFLILIISEPAVIEHDIDILPMAKARGLRGATFLSWCEQLCKSLRPHGRRCSSQVLKVEIWPCNMRSDHILQYITVSR